MPKKTIDDQLTELERKMDSIMSGSDPLKDLPGWKIAVNRTISSVQNKLEMVRLMLGKRIVELEKKMDDRTLENRTAEIEKQLNSYSKPLEDFQEWKIAVNKTIRSIQDQLAERTRMFGTQIHEIEKKIDSYNKK